MITKFKIFENVEDIWLFLNELYDNSKEELIKFIDFFMIFNHSSFYSIGDELFIRDDIYVDNDKNKKLIYVFINGEIQYEDVNYSKTYFNIKNGKLEQLNKEDLIKILKTMFIDRLNDLDIDLNIITEEDYSDFFKFSYFFNKSYEVFEESTINIPKTWKEFIKQKTIKKFKI